jgi:hypothetical protein
MASPHVAGALALLASNNHNGKVEMLYRQLTKNGNFNFTDKAIDPFKEPLLDVTNLPNANIQCL